MNAHHRDTLDRASRRCTAVASELLGLSNRCVQARQSELDDVCRELRAELLAADAEIREVRDAVQPNQEAA